MNEIKESVKKRGIGRERKRRRKKERRNGEEMRG